MLVMDASWEIMKEHWPLLWWWFGNSMYCILWHSFWFYWFHITILDQQKTDKKIFYLRNIAKDVVTISQSQIKVIHNFNTRRAQIEGSMFDVLLYVRRILILDARFISFWQISNYSDVLKKTFKKFLFGYRVFHCMA